MDKGKFLEALELYEKIRRLDAKITLEGYHLNDKLSGFLEGEFVKKIRNDIEIYLNEEFNKLKKELEAL